MLFYCWHWQVLGLYQKWKGIIKKERKTFYLFSLWCIIHTYLPTYLLHYDIIIIIVLKHSNDVFGFSFVGKSVLKIFSELNKNIDSLAEKVGYFL